MCPNVLLTCPIQETTDKSGTSLWDSWPILADDFFDPLYTLIWYRFSIITLATSAYNNIGIIGIVSEQLQGKLRARVGALFWKVGVQSSEVNDSMVSQARIINSIMSDSSIICSTLGWQNQMQQTKCSQWKSQSLQIHGWYTQHFATKWITYLQIMTQTSI